MRKYKIWTDEGYFYILTAMNRHEFIGDPSVKNPKVVLHYPWSGRDKTRCKMGKYVLLIILMPETGKPEFVKVRTKIDYLGHDHKYRNAWIKDFTAVKPKQRGTTPPLQRFRKRLQERYEEFIQHE